LVFLSAGWLVLPAFSVAQGSQKAKPKTQGKTTAKPVPAAGFTISGDIKGYPDGTTVAFLNGQTGSPEMQTTITANKFEFKGKMERPDFKIILINNQQPFLALFLDNSKVKITGTKETFEKSKVTGSKSHTEFEQFNNSLEPYQSVFSETAEYDSAKTAQAAQLLLDFVDKHKSAYITPLAVIRYNQLTDDPVKTEELYNSLDPQIRTSPMGMYIAQLVTEGKKTGTGTVLADFSQADTSGVQVSLSSFRGNYVLVDFWASWCGPCRQENPNLVAAYNKYKSKKFTVLGVSLDKARQPWIDAIAMDGLTWTQVSDLQGWANAVALQFQIASIPQNFLLDPEGRVIGKNLRGAALERKLARILR